MANASIRKPESLTMLVARHLREAIITAEYALGEALSEERIATTLAVSRTPVREAFGLLQLQGLIEIVPQKGSYVFLPSAEDIALLAEHRALLEAQALRLAHARAPRALRADLEKALALMEAARTRKNPAGYARGDDLFHLAAFSHCGNRYLADAYASISGRVAALRYHLAGPLKLNQSRSLAEHRALVKALAAGDVDAALAALGEHIGQMGADYRRAIEAGLLAIPAGRPRLKGPRARPIVKSTPRAPRPSTRRPGTTP
jgi:DNA-binding GntR family transcriptional regulator